MKIVIDIPEKYYKKAKEYIDADVELGTAFTAIAKGTPLPKGHGRLIDAEELLTVTDIREDGSEFTYVPFSLIEDAKTIIESEKIE